MPPNYTTTHCLYGMMSKRDRLLDVGDLPFNAVHKNRKKVFLFPRVEFPWIDLRDVYRFCQQPQFAAYEKIGIQYVVDENYEQMKMLLKHFKHSKSHSTLLLSRLNDEFFDLSGKKYREIREARNKWDKRLDVRVNEPLNQFEEQLEQFIDWWNQNPGKKYGWQRHSGYDLAFFKKHYEVSKSDLVCLTFYDVYYENLVGYAVGSKKLQSFGEHSCVPYLVRKTRTDYRNLSLFVDFCLFRYFYEQQLCSAPFYVNWGASSKNLLWFKKKFPVGCEKKVWTVSFKRQDFVPFCEQVYDVEPMIM